MSTQLTICPTVAAMTAALEDWQHFTWYTGVRYVTTDLCPTCYPKWEREQEGAHR